MEEELRRSASAWRVFAAVILVLWVASAIAVGIAYPSTTAAESAWVVFAFLAGSLGVLLMAGLIYSMSRLMDGVAELTDLVRSGRDLPSTPTAVEPPLPVVAAGGLRVKQPGAYLREKPEGDALDWLAPGTIVVEEERQGDAVLVTSPVGASGWVDARNLEKEPGP